MNDEQHRTPPRIPAAAHLQPIERPRQLSLPEQVRQRLSDSIASGSLAAGQLLVVDQLAATLGVSKTPIREALGTLLRDGLIRQTPSGFRVAPLDAEYVREVYAVRSALESLVAEVIAPTLTSDDLLEFEKTLHAATPRNGGQAIEHLGPDGDTEWWGRNLAFHDVMRAKCPWPYLNSLIDTIHTHRARFKSLEDSESHISRKAAYEEHVAILDAFKQHDGQGARALVQAHLDRLRDELAHMAEQQGMA
jgi:DNA-binding GntR family transcriptional regulator